MSQRIFIFYCPAGIKTNKSEFDVIACIGIRTELLEDTTNQQPKMKKHSYLYYIRHISQLIKIYSHSPTERLKLRNLFVFRLHLRGIRKIKTKTLAFRKPQNLLTLQQTTEGSQRPYQMTLYSRRPFFVPKQQGEREMIKSIVYKQCWRLLPMSA